MKRITHRNSDLVQRTHERTLGTAPIHTATDVLNEARDATARHGEKRTLEAQFASTVAHIRELEARMVKTAKAGRTAKLSILANELTKAHHRVQELAAALARREPITELIEGDRKPPERQGPIQRPKLTARQMASFRRAKGIKGRSKPSGGGKVTVRRIKRKG